MRHRLTTMLKRLLIVFSLLLVGACDSPPSVPTPPTAPPPANTPPPTPFTQVRVTGRVTDERGMPISGASLTELDTRTVGTVTDAGGSYELFGAFGSQSGFGLLVTRDGYEPNYQWVPSAAEAVQNFRLRNIVRITTGKGLTVVVDSDDTFYGAAEQYRARRVRVVAHGTGNLVVDGSSSNAGRRVLLSARDLEDTPCCPARLDLSVSTGQEVTVHVLTYWEDVPAEFSVTTRLEPR